MTPPSVVLHPLHPRGVDAALRALDVDVLQPEGEEFVEAIGLSGILVSTVWDDRFLPGLKWLQAISAGHDQFPCDLLADRGVVLTTASGVHIPQVAEHAFAMLLALTRGIGAATRNAGNAVWKPMMLSELTGSTLGILGLGSIGEDIAWRAKAWNMHVIGTKRNPTGYRGSADEVFGPERTAEVFERSDAVVSVLPGGVETDSLVSRAMLESLDGWFVNLGRGNAATEEDILAAIDSGGLRGAALDVFAVEPLPATSPLWSHPRVIVTPHMAGMSPRYGERLAEIVSHNLRAFRGVGEWRNRVV